MHSVVKKRFKYEVGKIDWDFTGENSYSASEGLSSLHWYPARFIPQIPSILIGYFSEKEDIVLDPFCGSGTTLVEAFRLDRYPVGLDINPVSVMISRAKMLDPSRLNPSEVLAQLSHATFVKRNLEKRIPNYEENKRWYQRDTLRELAAIHESILHTRDKSMALAAFVCFSSILRSCCSQRRHWGYVCDNVHPKPNEVVYRPAIAIFKERLRQFIECKRQFHDRLIAGKKRFVKYADARVLEGDARGLMTVLDRESVDLIVTSPPYLNVTDYIKSQRLSFLWMPKSEMMALRKNEIGARSNRGRKSARDEYLWNMGICIQEMRDVLRRGKYLCIVLGASKSYPNYVEDVKKTCADKGFKLENSLGRNISRFRSLSPRILTETIFIFKK